MISVEETCNADIFVRGEDGALREWRFVVFSDRRVVPVCPGDRDRVFNLKLFCALD